jgi:hypothetical protein
MHVGCSRSAPSRFPLPVEASKVAVLRRLGEAEFVEFIGLFKDAVGKVLLAVKRKAEEDLG